MAIGPGLELQSGRAFTKLTNTTGVPLFVFSSLGLWAWALDPDNTIAIAAICTTHVRRFIRFSLSGRSSPSGGWIPGRSASSHHNRSKEFGKLPSEASRTYSRRVLRLNFAKRGDQSFPDTTRPSILAQHRPALCSSRHAAR